MENIFILSTDQPSRLHYYHSFTPQYALSKEPLNWRTASHIYITSDEEIKDKDYVLSDTSIGALYLDGEMNTSSMLAEGQWKKVILTTDPKLITDGVQAIDDEFLEWFVKNPTCEFIKVTKLDYLTNRQYRIYNLPQEEPKQSTLEEAAKEFYPPTTTDLICSPKLVRDAFIAGGKHMAERMYSEQIELINWLQQSLTAKKFYSTDAEDLIEQFKKK